MLDIILSSYYNHNVIKNRKGTKMIKNVKELKDFRRRERISQRGLSKITKISRGTIATWERTNRITKEGLDMLNKKLFQIPYEVIDGAKMEEYAVDEKRWYNRAMGWLCFSLREILPQKSRRVAGPHPTYSKKGK